MADNPRYQQAGIGYSSYPITPGVDRIDLRTKAAAAGDIASVLDRMASNVYAVAAEEAQRKGLMWGAQNPVTVDQLNAAVSAGDDPLAKRGTYFGDSARRVQASVLGSNLNAKGVEEMARIQAAVEVGQVPLSAGADQMNAVSDAYANTLMKVDPESGVKLRAALTSHSSSVYKYLAGEEVKKFTAAQKASVDDWMAKLPKTLESIYLGGDIMGADGILKTGDDLAKVQRAQAVQAARITGDASYGTKFDKALGEAKINAYTKLFADPSYAKDPATALSRIESGDIGDEYKTSWEYMTEEEKTKVKEQTVKAFAQRYDVVKKTQDHAEAQMKDQTRALELEFWSPSTGGKRKAEIIKAVRSMGVISPDAYKSMVKGDGEGADQSTEARVSMMIFRGEVTTEEQLNRVVPAGAARTRLTHELQRQLNADEKEGPLIIQEAVAGTKSPFAVMNSTMDAERLNMMNRYNREVAEQRATGKPFSYRDIALRITEEYAGRKQDAKFKPMRDDLADVEREVSASVGRAVTIKSMNDIADIEKMGGWKDKNKLKDKAIRALRVLNAPVLIPETPR